MTHCPARCAGDEEEIYNMKLEYDYTIGPEGIVFSLIEGHDDGIDFQGSAADRMTIQKYIMLAWQEAINKTSAGPEEIRQLMATEEGQGLLRRRADDYLTRLLDNIPPELDRRHQPDRRDTAARPRAANSDRRRNR